MLSKRYGTELKQRYENALKLSDKECLEICKEIIQDILSNHISFADDKILCGDREYLQYNTFKDADKAIALLHKKFTTERLV